jgi:ParB/RepB/Spo0J family partition protein
METQVISIAKLLPSATNPRKHFDEDKLKELAASIKEHGVLQNLVVRKHDKDRYEIIAGERRFRACKIAGKPFVNCNVVEMDDMQVREVQLIENLQRSDLSPLEEARGYQDLLDKHGYGVEDLAAKLGKSTSHVRGYLKVCSLPDKAAKALEDGTLNMSVAQLIARIPGVKAREECTAWALQTDYMGEVPSFRMVKRQIEHKYMVELKGAPFDRKSLTLVPAAGSCDKCPKRSGNNPDYAGTRADICTDPECFQTKARAHGQLELEQAAKAGVKILPEKEAKKLFEHGQLRFGSGYRDADLTCYEGVSSGTFRNVVGDKAVAEHQVKCIGPDGKAVTLIPEKIVRAALQKKRDKSNRPASDSKWKREAEERQRKEAQLRKALFDAVYAKSHMRFGSLVGLSATPVLATCRTVLGIVLDNNGPNFEDWLCTHLEMPLASDPTALDERLGKLKGGELLALLAVSQVAGMFYNIAEQIKNKAYVERFEAMGVNIEDVTIIAERSKESTCRKCGCTDSRACEGGCTWTDPDLCSACAAKGEKPKTAKGKLIFKRIQDAGKAAMTGKPATRAAAKGKAKKEVASV